LIITAALYEVASEENFKIIYTMVYPSAGQSTTAMIKQTVKTFDVIKPDTVARRLLGVEFMEPMQR